MMNGDIQGYGGGGDSSGQQGSVESPDNLQSIAYARVLDLWGEGELQGFVHPTNVLQDLALNGTPVANADGSLNFKNVKFDSRSGSQSQTFMSGFPDVENETGVGVELKSSTPWTQTITDLQLTAIRVRLSMPSIQKSDTATGDITGYTVQYAIDLKTDSGEYQQCISSAFTGKSTSKYERAHRIDLPPATTGWTVRVRRLTANANLATVADTTTVESYTEITDGKFRYPNSAYGGLIVDASQFSSIPTRAFYMYGRIVSVPSNYNPTTRVYTGTWDGTFKPAWTNNPAWIFYDLVTNARFGLGDYCPASLINKWVLYTIAQYCDGMVSDGFGGQEPRMTCSVFLQTQAEAYKVMQDLASVFRGIIYWAGGAIQSVADMPSDPVYTYTAANVIDGAFAYQGSGRKTRYTVALVSWNDMTDFGRAKVEYVSDDEGIARYGVQPIEITAFGCTSRAQAHRVGLWTLYTSRLETGTVTFKVGLDGTLCAPGQIIRVSDPARAGKRQAGRIHSATATAITVDSAPTVAVGDAITCALPTGITETHAVTGVSGNVISVASPGFSIAPGAESVWVVESSTLVAETYRVVSVLDDSSGDDISFTVTALQHNASKFNAIDFGDALMVPPVSVVPPSSQAGPASVTISSNETAGTVLASILLSVGWTATANAVRYQCEWRKDNGEWQSLGDKLRGLSADIHNAKPGTYYARVRAFNANGVGSAPTLSDALVIADQTKQPTKLSDLKTEVDDAAQQAQIANAELAQIADDSLLSPPEKPTIERDYSVLTTEQAGIDAQASAYSITTEKTAYDSAVSALTAYLATLTAPVAWNDKSGYTDIVGATFRSKFAAVYTARQTLLNAIYAKAQALANAAQGTANTANANTPTVGNPQFSLGLAGWSPDGAGWTAQSTGSPNPQITTCAEFYNGATNAGLYNNTSNPCQPGDRFTATGQIKGSSGTGNAYVGVAWFNSSKGLISISYGNGITGSANGTSRSVGTAPAGAVYCEAVCAVLGYTTGGTGGAYFFTGITLAPQPNSLSETPDGTTRFAVSAVDPNKKALIDFTQTGHLAKHLGNIADDPTSTRYAVSNIDGNRRALIDFTQSGHVNKNVDNIGDGATYARTKTASLQNGIPLQASTGRNLVVNGSFEANLSGSTFGDGWIVSGGVGILSRALGVSGAPSHAVLQYNQAPASVIPTGVTYCVVNSAASLTGFKIGDTVLLSAQFSAVGAALPAGITGSAQVRIIYFDGTGAQTGVLTVTSPQTSGWPTVTASGVVPTGTASAQAQVLVYTNNTTGSAYTVPAGSYPFWGYVDNIAAYALANIDTDVQDGTNYGRTSNLDLYSSGGVNRVGLRIAGSGHQLGDQRNLLPITVASLRSVLNTSPITYTITSGSPNSTVNFSVGAFTLQAGSASVSYNAASHAIAQANGTTTTWYLLFIDPGYAGGTQSLVVTTSPTVAAQYDGAVNIGSATVTVASGGGGSSGSGSGGGGWCVCDDMWIDADTQAKDARPGYLFDCCDLPTRGTETFTRALQSVDYHDEECVRLTTEGGAVLDCGHTTPFDTVDGRTLRAPDMQGETVLTDHGLEKVASVEWIGTRRVCYFHFGGISYAAGRDPTHRIYSHNTATKP